MNLDFSPRNEERGLMLRRLFILFATMVCGLLFAGVLQMVVGNETAARVRIMALVQDMFLFIAPAVITALMSSRLPARFLRIDTGFTFRVFLVSVILLYVSVPLQNALIEWNKAITLPAALSRSLTEMEQAAELQINTMLGGTSVMDLIVGILIVGIFAALSEELFYRGALQRVIRGYGRNAHAAIWISAVIFSAMHLQFYGFLPRLLLGALFGYLVWWSGSLWLPITVHALNNSTVVVTRWLDRCHGTENSIETFGANSWPMILLSVILTIAALGTIHRLCRQKMRSASSGERSETSSLNP